MESRDKQVIEFVNLAGICTRDQIKKMFFKEVHQNICMRRLKKIAEDEYIKRFKFDGNTYVYYSDKKPSKRIVNHDLYITDFLVNMIEINFKILQFKRSYVIGSIIPDAYIKYEDEEGKTRHLVLEIQLSNTVEDCVVKYKNFKNIILENEKEWVSIPRIIVITDMQQRLELRGLKVLYDTTALENINQILRG